MEEAREDMELRIIKAMKEIEEKQRKGKIIRRGW